MTKEEWASLFYGYIYDTKGNKAQAIKKIQDYIKKNYSFSIGKNAEGYVYYGSVDYTSAARDFIRVLFKIPLNTFIIVRFRLWHLLMKS